MAAGRRAGAPAERPARGGWLRRAPRQPWRRQRASGRRAGVPALVASLPENMPGTAAEKIAGLGLVPGHGLEEHLRAVAGAAQIGAHRRGLADGALPVQIWSGGRYGDTARMLDAAAAKTLLAQFGLPVPTHRVCSSVEEAVAAAVEFGVSGQRCAMKILGDFKKNLSFPNGLG